MFGILTLQLALQRRNLSLVFLNDLECRSSCFIKLFLRFLQLLLEPTYDRSLRSAFFRQPVLLVSGKVNIFLYFQHNAVFAWYLGEIEVVWVGGANIWCSITAGHVVVIHRLREVWVRSQTLWLNEASGRFLWHELTEEVEVRVFNKLLSLTFHAGENWFIVRFFFFIVVWLFRVHLLNTWLDHLHVLVFL